MLLKSFVIIMLQTAHFLRQKQARNDMEQRKNNSFSFYKEKIDLVSLCYLRVFNSYKYENSFRHLYNRIPINT